MGREQYILYCAAVNTPCITSRDTIRIMTIADRLTKARQARHFETPTDAWRAMAERGISIAKSSYISYENGHREPGRKTAESLARFYRVNLEWLLTDRGEMTNAPPKVAKGIPVVGIVGAGSTVEPIGETSAVDLDHEIDALTDETTIALRVRGDSQYPRFMDGEFIVADREPGLPDEMIGHYAVVDTNDGRRMIKIVRRGSRPGLFRLESHNAPPEDDVMIIAARRYKATIAAPPHRLAIMRRRG